MATASLRRKYPSWAKPSVPLEQERSTAAVLPGAGIRAEMQNEANQADLRKIQEWWLQARESQSFVRLEMDIDENFYHGDQFTDEDRRALEDVGQAPLVFNKVKDRKSTRLNSSHIQKSRMPSSA